MKIENFRTKLFKQMVLTIAKSKMTDNQSFRYYRGNTFHYNMDRSGNIKSIKVNGEIRNDIIAYYWFDNGTLEYPFDFITYNEYLEFKRGHKINQILDKETEIVTEFKGVKTEKRDAYGQNEFQVGDEVFFIFDRKRITGKVIKKTPRTLIVENELTDNLKFKLKRGGWINETACEFATIYLFKN